MVTLGASIQKLKDAPDDSFLKIMLEHLAKMEALNLLVYPSILSIILKNW